MFGGAYVTSVAVTPVGCLPNDCDLIYLAYATQPPRNRLNAIDIDFVARAANEIRANRGGYSDTGFLRGIAAGWEIPNPTESTVGANDGRAARGCKAWALAGTWSSSCKRQRGWPQSGGVTP